MLPCTASTAQAPQPNSHNSTKLTQLNATQCNSKQIIATHTGHTTLCNWMQELDHNHSFWKSLSSELIEYEFCVNGFLMNYSNFYKWSMLLIWVRKNTKTIWSTKKGLEGFSRYAWLALILCICCTRDKYPGDERAAVPGDAELPGGRRERGGGGGGTNFCHGGVRAKYSDPTFIEMPTLRAGVLCLVHSSMFPLSTWS